MSQESTDQRERNSEAWLLATSRFPRARCGCGQPVWYHWMDDPAGPASRKRMRHIANCSGVWGVPEIEAEYERLVSEAVIRRLEGGQRTGADPAGRSGFIGIRFNKVPIVKSHHVPGSTYPVQSWNGNSYSTYQKVQATSSAHYGHAVFWKEADPPLIRPAGVLDGPDGLEAKFSDPIALWAAEALGELPDLSWGAQPRQLAEYLAPRIRKPRWRKKWALVSRRDLDSLMIIPGKERRQLTIPLTDHPVLLEELRWRAELLHESMSARQVAEVLHLSPRQVYDLLRGPKPDKPEPYVPSDRRSVAPRR